MAERLGRTPGLIFYENVPLRSVLDNVQTRTLLHLPCIRCQTSAQIPAKELSFRRESDPY